jgi:cell division protein FtsL
MLIGLVLVGGWLCVSKYGVCVSLEHDIYAIEKNIDQMHAHNAELKSMLYKQSDIALLESIAEEKGMVQDKNPQWAFVSE